MAARFLHIALAMATLFSSAGVVLNQHYCQGERKNTALFVQPKSCHQKQSCPLHGDDQKGNGCCANSSHYYQLDQDQLPTSADVLLPFTPVFPPAIVLMFLPAIPSANNPRASWLTYRPPIVEDEIWLRFENFRC